jgi:hypothetical protein
LPRRPKRWIVVAGITLFVALSATVFVLAGFGKENARGGVVLGGKSMKGSDANGSARRHPDSAEGTSPRSEVGEDSLVATVLGPEAQDQPSLDTDGISLGMTLNQVRRRCNVRPPALSSGELWPISFGGALNSNLGGEEFEFLFDRQGLVIAYGKLLYRDSIETAIDRLVARFGKTERPPYRGFQGNSFVWYHFKDAIVVALLPSSSQPRLSVWSKPWLVAELRKLNSKVRRDNLDAIRQSWLALQQTGARGVDLVAPEGCKWEVGDLGKSLDSEAKGLTFTLIKDDCAPGESVGTASQLFTSFLDGLVSAGEEVDVLPEVLRAQSWRERPLAARGANAEFLAISGLQPLTAHALALIVADYFPPGSDGIEWRGSPSGRFSWQSGRNTRVEVDGYRLTLTSLQ